MIVTKQNQPFDVTLLFFAFFGGWLFLPYLFYLAYKFREKTLIWEFFVLHNSFQMNNNFGGGQQLPSGTAPSIKTKVLDLKP